MAKDFQSMMNRFSSPKVQKNTKIVEKTDESSEEIDVKKEVEKILKLKNDKICHCKECNNYIENDEKYPNNCLALNEIIPIDKCWACTGRKCSCAECGNYVEDDERYNNNCKVLETVISKENCWARVTKQEALEIELSINSKKPGANKIRIDNKRKVTYIPENTIQDIINLYKKKKISLQLLRKIAKLDHAKQYDMANKIISDGLINEEVLITLAS